MIQKLQKLFFYSLILSIPIQTGKHFWPTFSKIAGIRVDYLSPTLYISDIVILSFIIVTGITFIQKSFWFIQNQRLNSSNKKVLSKQRKTITLTFLHNKKLWFFAFFLISLCISTLFAKNFFAALYGWVKYLEFGLLGISIAVFFDKKQIKPFIYSLLIGSLFSSGVALTQFFLQSSIGGIFYIFGERTFTASTPGIAIFAQDGLTLLRPYGTFAHPNLLAFYLFMTTVCTLLYVRTLSVSKKSIAIYFLTLINSLTLLVTFSRSILVLFAVFLISYTLKLRQTKLKTLILIFCIFGAGLYLWLFSGRFLTVSNIFVDSSYRFDLLAIGWDIFIKHVLFGVGPKNFFVYEVPYIHAFSPIFLQPVHNVLLLTLVETGIVGGLVLLLGTGLTFKRLIGAIKRSSGKEHSFIVSLFWIFSGIILVSLGDHFFITLQQGLLFSAVTMGLLWSRVTELD